MSADALRPWATEALAVSPYPERQSADPKALDDAVERVLAGARHLRVGSRRIVRSTHRHRTEMRALDGPGLRAAAARLRVDLVRHGFEIDLVGRAFALVGEAARREFGFEHHPVQLIGGYVMLRGRIAEMRTGEGKTVTALLPAATAALAGMPVHVVTVNDYLAARDADQLRPVYAALGLSVGLAQHGQEPEERRAAYAADVTYCTNKELAFDYLRDRIASRDRPSARRALLDRVLAGGSPGGPLLLRGLHFAIVDEADSVLIDEARTPLIISAPAGEGAGLAVYRQALDLAAGLVAGEDFVVLPADKLVYLTPSGEAKAARLAEGRRDIWASRRAREETLTQALSALHVFRRDHQYIVTDGTVQIVDEYTGRVMADRKWQRGLQQLIEIKEGCEPSTGRETIAQITYQRLFRRYLWLCGMTGTASEVGPELRSVYRLEVVRIPTHRPSLMRRRRLRYFPAAEARWDAVVQATAEMAAQGRPVLIGTRSVAASELIAGRLAAVGLAPVVLNARQDSAEAEAVARAGASGQVTVATNMAGRGTDIRPSAEVIARGGLHVILTEFHESARIDRQLIGRTGRQGNPGSWDALVALDDELFASFAGWISGLVRRLSPDGALPRPVGSALRWLAQRRAERSHARARREAFRRGRQQDRAFAFVSWTE